MDLQLENKIVLVTGGAKGIGAGSCELPLRKGIFALTREWAAELLGYGIRVNAVIPAEVMTRSTGSGSIQSPIPNRSASLSCPRSLWRKE